MNDFTRDRDWVNEAQKLLLSLKDIAGAGISLTPDGSDIEEINILAEGHRPPKQIVRDVRSALRAEYKLDLDYRKISVAQKREGEPAASSAPDAPTVLTLPAAHVDQEPAATRFRFVEVHVRLSPRGSVVQVELAFGDREAVGEARGGAARGQVARLVGEATLDAVVSFLDPGYSLELRDLRVSRLGGEEVVLAAIDFYKGRHNSLLTGSAAVHTDLQQAAVYATLAGLNRILGRLRYREPVEYEIRPSSIS